MQRAANSPFSANESQKSVRNKHSLKSPSKRAKDNSNKSIELEKKSIADSSGIFEDYDSDSGDESPGIFEGYDSDSGDESPRQSLDMKGVNQYLEGKVGADINAKKWLEGCSGLDDVEKSDVIIWLIYELFLAKDVECDSENTAAGNKDENKRGNMNAREIFKVIERIIRFLLAQDRRKLVQLICQTGNVMLLEMVCQREMKDGKSSPRICNNFPWRGKFTGYQTLTDLLLYVLEQRCSPQIVLCIAKKVFGWHHNLLCGKEYLEGFPIQNLEDIPNPQGLTIENCFKAAIELGYIDTVLVMLAGDVYHCIREMKDEKFREEKIFCEALDMVIETIADVVTLWGKRLCKNEIQNLLAEGVEVDIGRMTKKYLLEELEYHEIKLSKDEKESQEGIVKLKELKAKIRLRIRKHVVGALISTLFFNHRNELMELLIDKKTF